MRERRLHGADVAGILDKHFGRPDAQPSELVEAVHGVYVPIHRNDHIVAAALRAEHYPPAPAVLAAHAVHLARQSPTANRYVDAAIIADCLTAGPPNRCGCATGQRDHIVQQYLAVLDRPDWRAAIRAGRGLNSDFFAWFTGHLAARLRLRDVHGTGDGRIP